MRALSMALLLIAASVANDSRAVGYEEAVRAYQAGQYEAAARALEPLAASGDAKAQVRLGLMYREGRGVGRDPFTAFQWLLRAARSGRADAQYLVGTMYRRGEGTKRDVAAGQAWLRRAAAQGNAKAAAALKDAGGTGHDVAANEAAAAPGPAPTVDPAMEQETQSVLAAMDPPPSPAEAAAIRKAAAHGIRVVDGPVAALRKKAVPTPVEPPSSWQPADAPTSLQDVMHGHAVAPRGPVAAVEDSAEQGGEPVAPKPAVPPPKVAMQQTVARAQAGDAIAQRQLAAAYLRGNGVPQDAARAAQWYRKAAVAGDAESQYVLSRLYFNGVGVPRDRNVGIQWLRRAAAQGHSGARAQLSQTGN